MRSNPIASIFVVSVLAVVGCNHPEPPASPANAAADTAAIERLGSAFDDAWRQKDPRARAGLFADEASLINPFGQRAKGRAEIESVFSSETQTVANGSTHRFGAMAISFLDPDKALVDADNEIDGLHGPDGREAPPMKYHLVGVAERTGAGWRWLAGRPYAFLPPPGGAPGPGGTGTH